MLSITSQILEFLVMNLYKNKLIWDKVFKNGPSKIAEDNL